MDGEAQEPVSRTGGVIKANLPSALNLVIVAQGKLVS